MNLSINLTIKDLIYALRKWIHKETEDIENNQKNDVESLLLVPKKNKRSHKTPWIEEKEIS